MHAILAPMTPFVTPVRPDPLKFTLPATQYEISLAKAIHDKALKKFQAYQLIQRALVQQVLECIEDKYLTTLCNRITGQDFSVIRALVLHFFGIYWKITPQKFRANHRLVEEMSYKIKEPIDIIFSVVEDLFKIGELARLSFSPAHIVSWYPSIVFFAAISENRWEDPSLYRRGITSSRNSQKPTKSCEMHMQQSTTWDYIV